MPVTKCRSDEEKLKLQAHLVANRQHQKHGLDYSETFVPTINMTTICTILAIAAHHDWDSNPPGGYQVCLPQCGAEGYHLHTPSTTQIPQGGRPQKGIAAEAQPLQSLKQARFKWSEELKKFFLDYGFKHSQVDQAVYFCIKAEEHTVITVSVDDMAVTSKHLMDIEHFKVELYHDERFEISDLGKLT